MNISSSTLLLVGLLTLGACGIQKKAQQGTPPPEPKLEEAPNPPPPTTESPAISPTPSPSPEISETPWILGRFKNTSSYVYQNGNSWKKTVHWTLDIKKDSVVYTSHCEYTGSYNKKITVEAPSKIALDLNKNTLSVLETKHFTDPTRMCEVKTVPGDYRFERSGSLMTLTNVKSEGEYFYLKEK